MKQSDTRTFASMIAAIVIAAVLCFCSLATATGCDEVTTSASSAVSSAQSDNTYTFRTNKLRKEHYNKHGKAMGFADAKSYEAAASAVATNPRALHKLEKEDNDDVYYLQETDELVIISTDGYIRTYFNPGGIGYFNRQ